MKKIIISGLFVLAIFSNAVTQEVLNVSLQEAQKLAQQKNPILQMQMKSVAAQKGKYWAALMPEKPEIGIEIEAVPKGQSYSNYQEKKMFLSQTLEFPTNYYFRHKLLNAEIQHEIFGVEGIKRDVTFLVKKAYFNVLLQTEFVELAKKNLELYKDFFNKTSRSYELGETKRLNMLKSKNNWGVGQKKFNSRQKDFQGVESQLRKILVLKNEDRQKIAFTDTNL